MIGGNAVRPARTKPDTREEMCQALVRPVNIIRQMCKVIGLRQPDG